MLLLRSHLSSFFPPFFSSPLHRRPIQRIVKQEKTPFHKPTLHFFPAIVRGYGRKYTQNNPPFSSPVQFQSRPHHIPAPILILLTTASSSTTIPLLLSTSSNASTTLSKLLFAPFSCVKRAIAMLALLPRWSRVWNSAAREREGMWRAINC